MTNKTTLISIALCLLFITNLSAQKVKYFSEAIDGFSKKKTAYITLNSGEEIQGTIKKVKRKKWLFEEINFNKEDGENVKLKGKDIKHMYLPQSGFDKLSKAADKAYDATEWDGSSNLNQEYLKDGYAYFESTEVNYKKDKVEVLLLQLLNPSFPSKVRVYHDPTASEKGGMRVGGFKVTESIDKSFWVKIGDKPAFKLKKKHYDDQAENLYSECPDFAKSMKKYDWKKFPEDVKNYTENCK